MAARNSLTREITAANGQWIRRHIRQFFQTAEQRWLNKGEIQLCSIEHMKQNDLVALMAEMAQPSCNLVHVVKKIAQENNQAAPSDPLGNLIQDGTEMSLFAPRVLVQDAQYLLELGTLSGGLNHVSEPIIKGNESDAIALPEQQMG